MARYIDADKLEDGSFAEVTSEYQQGWNDALYAASISLPTADVVEVKHGEWKIKRDDYDCEYMMCSVCKEEFYPVDEVTVDTTPNYCPKCGAKMDGERKDT